MSELKIGDIVRVTREIRSTNDERTWTITQISVSGMVGITTTDDNKLTSHGVFTSWLELVTPVHITEFNEEWKKLTSE